MDGAAGTSQVTGCMMSQEQEKSVGWVAFALAVAVAYFGWAFLAADYYQNGGAGGPSQTNFFVNSVVQLPHCVQVARYALGNRVWAIGLIVVGEVAVLIVWSVLKKVERDLART